MIVSADSVSQLDSFDPAERQGALDRIARQIDVTADAMGNVNMHCHSFFSYNSEGWSPSRIAYEARQRGWYAAGLTDFDVLDGLDEFMAAGQKLGLRTAVHLETRAFLAELADVDISSPGEPGVTYIMGSGFAAVPRAGSPQAQTLARLRSSARERNEELIARINVALPAIALDYGADVLPLTPQQVATERHIMSAYVNKAEAVMPQIAHRAAFWASLFKMDADQVAALLDNPPELENKVRSALAKRGGVGYVQPSRNTFPLVDDFVQWVLDCGALPTVTWLDGTSAGEADAQRLLEIMAAKGCVALNIIPERNWNIADAGMRATCVRNLRSMVAAAEAMNLPVNIGTEMNKKGLPLVDDLGGPVLSEFRDIFLRGAQIMVGHTVLAQFANFGYTSEPALNEMPNSAERNRFFAAVGALPPLTTARAEELAEAGPDKAFAYLAGKMSVLP